MNESIISKMILKIKTIIEKILDYNTTRRKPKRSLGIANGKYDIDYEEFNRLDAEIVNLFNA